MMYIRLRGWKGFFFSSRRRHTRCLSDWSSDVCSSDLYDLKRIAKFLTRQTLYARRADLWRYRELLPVRREDNIVSLGEGRSEERRVGKECRSRWARYH